MTAGWFLGYIVLQRLVELVWARANTARLRAGGAVEHAPGHYPAIVAVHAGWLAALAWWGHGRPVEPGWLAVYAILQAGRVWVLATLGRRWTTRILTVPGEAPVTRGPFRWLRHPNYAVVAAEIARIDAALDRIDNGAYGECVNCGEKIAEKRLELLPDTPFCANCAP